MHLKPGHIKRIVAIHNVLLLCLILSCRLLAQENEAVFFEHVTSEMHIIEKGLSQNSVNCILQDSRGFMWLGTWAGLNKYDGYSFSVYTRDNPLSGHTINDLLEDCSGNIWIATNHGLDRHNLRENSFFSYMHDDKDESSLINDHVTSLNLDSLGNVWIGTHSGLSMYDATNDSFYSFLNNLDNSPLRSNHINCLITDADGYVWIGTQKGLVCLDPYTENTLRYFHIPDDPYSLPDNVVHSLALDDDNNLLIGTASGLCRYSDEQKRFITIPINGGGPENFSIYSLYYDSKSALWIGTENHGLRILMPDSSVKAFFHDPLNNASLSNNRIRSIYEDNSGIIWVGTFIGLNKYDPFSGRFRHISASNPIENTLNSNYILSFLEDEMGKIWIATYNGINIYHRDKEIFSYIKAEKGNPNSLADNRTRCLAKDAHGTIWVGSQQSGITLVDPNTLAFSHYFHNPRDPNSLVSNNILCLFLDLRGNMWAGTNNGLAKFIPETNGFISFKSDPDDTLSLSSDNIWTIYQDEEDILWLGSSAGLNRLDLKYGTVKAYVHEKDDPSSIGANDVFFIGNAGEGKLWLGTKGGGLNLFDKNTASAIRYTEKDGLADNIVYAAVDDGLGSLWLSTNWGLSRFDIKNHLFVNYDVSDGIQSNEFNLGAYLKSKDGYLFFGGMNGFNVFNPARIKSNKRIPPLAITSFMVFHEKIADNIFNGDTIILKPSQNFFSIEFSALDYSNPGKNRYRYILEDYNHDWIATSADKRIAEYTDVDPGTYLFKINGSNNDGVWNPEPLVITIVVKPAWHETYAFLFGAPLLMLILIFFLINRRIRFIHNKHEIEKKVLAIEKQLQDTELKALRLQMNPHFIFNSLNSIQSFILTNDTDKAINYLGKFSQLMRMIMANSSESFISVKEELASLKNYMDLEKLRFDDKFNYCIELDPEIDEEFTGIPPMIIQPYVENAIIHGLIHKEEKGLIKISIELHDRQLLWLIEDNGVGRLASKRIREASGLDRKPRGMLITKERLKVLNTKHQDKFSVNIKDKQSSDGKSTGTIVELLISYADL